MVRLIDIDAIQFVVVGGRQDGKVEFARAFQKMLDEAPTVDAVPVIRCKDCKHWSEPDHVDNEYVESICRELGIFDTSPTSYCSYAKRKEE